MPGAVAWGSEFVVNSTTTGVQGDSHTTVLADGRIVVVWCSVEDTSNVRARVFNADGTPAGPDFLINSSLDGIQDLPDIVALPNGGFGVVFYDDGAISYRSFFSDGTSDYPESTITVSGYDQPSVTVLNNGQVFLTAIFGDDVRVMSLDTSGSTPIFNFTINTITTGSQEHPQITSIGPSSYVVTWTDYSQTGGDTDNAAIRMAIYNSGVRVPGDILVNTTTSSNQFASQVASLGNGNFVVVWTDESGGNTAVRAQMFTSAGTPVGTELLVNTTTGSDQHQADVTGLPDGRWVVVWIDEGSGGFGAIRGQVFNANGTMSGDEFVIDTTVSGLQIAPAVQVLADGRFIVTWNEPDGSLSGVHARIFDARDSGVFLPGSDFDDTLYGSDFADQILGAVGNDTLFGGLGDDVIEGEEGDDWIAGGSTGDADSLYGGDGVDTVSYRDATEGVVFSTDTGDGAAAGDYIENFEIFHLTDYADSIDLDALGNGEIDQVLEVHAHGGDDEVYSSNNTHDAVLAGDGNDTVYGSFGNDYYVGGLGNDVLNFVRLDDYLTWDVRLGVAIDIANEIGYTYYDTGDVGSFQNYFGLSGFELIQLTGGDDTLFASSADLTVYAGFGADDLTAGSGVDVFYGGEDSAIDTLRFASSSGAVTLNLATGVHGGAAAGDTFNGFERFFLSNGNDVITAGAGAIIGHGLDGNDTLTGSALNDELHGGSGIDVLTGGAGADILAGGAGADTLNGGLGTDLASYEAAASAIFLDLEAGFGTGDARGDVFVSIEQYRLSQFSDAYYGTAGADTVWGLGGADLLVGGGGIDTLNGGDGTDALYGDDGDDFLTGGLGADQLDGGIGNDTVAYGSATSINLTLGIHGGEAAGDVFESIERFHLSGDIDTFVGAAGVDTVFGFAGDDLLRGEGGNDVLDGGDGTDMLLGGLGDDTLRGALGDDFLIGGDGIDTLDGGEGADVVRGELGNDKVYGRDGEDLLYGGLGDDSLYGEAGDDFVRGEFGDDLIWGDLGADTLYGDNGADRLDGGAGADILYGGAGDDRVYGGDDADTAYGGDGIDLFWGGLGDDVLWGQNDNDTLRGEDGNDTLRGDAGDDYLYGQEGADTLYGGDGLDRVYGGNGADQVYGGLGNDQLYGEADADSLRGEDGNDNLRGGDGNDFLYGGDGNDRLEGGAGIDRLYGQSGADTFAFVNGDLTAPGVSVDRIHDFNAGEGDIIDLSGIDANSTLGGDQAFVKVAAFTNVAGQYVLQTSSGYVTALFDTNGDGTADLALRVDGASNGIVGWVL